MTITMTQLARPLTSIGRFLRREEGAVSIEAAILLPFLGFAYVAGFAYFDNYRREVLLTKATYTVADILSRETTAVTAADLEGLQELFEFLTFSDGQTRLRFTQIERVAGELVVTETATFPDSYGTDGTLAMTDAQLETVRHRIPRLEDGQVIVLTESFTVHEPIFDVGLIAREYHRIAPTRNRVRRKLPWIVQNPPVLPEEPPFDPLSLPAPTIDLFDTIALVHAPDPMPVTTVTPTSTGGADPGDEGGKKNGNNGHGNDADRNDDSNPGNSNDPDDDTDDDGTPGNNDD